MIILATKEFNRWLLRLKDKNAKAKILLRLQRIEKKNHFGDMKYLQNGLYELRFTEGKGYRVYYSKIDYQKALMIHGGHKDSQAIDIERAINILKDYEL